MRCRMENPDIARISWVRFSLKFGLLLWGLPTGLLFWLATSWWNGSEYNLRSLASCLALFAFTGFFMYGPMLRWSLIRRQKRLKQ